MSKKTTPTSDAPAIQTRTEQTLTLRRPVIDSALRAVVATRLVDAARVGRLDYSPGQLISAAQRLDLKIVTSEAPLAARELTALDDWTPEQASEDLAGYVEALEQTVVTLRSAEAIRARKQTERRAKLDHDGVWARADELMIMHREIVSQATTALDCSEDVSEVDAGTVRALRLVAVRAAQLGARGLELTDEIYEAYLAACERQSAEGAAGVTLDMSGSKIGQAGLDAIARGAVVPPSTPRKRTWLAMLQVEDGADVLLASCELPEDYVQVEQWLIELAEAQPDGDLVYLARDEGTYWSGKTQAAPEEPAQEQRDEAARDVLSALQRFDERLRIKPWALSDSYGWRQRLATKALRGAEVPESAVGILEQPHPGQPPLGFSVSLTDGDARAHADALVRVIDALEVRRVGEFKAVTAVVAIRRLLRDERGSVESARLRCVSSSLISDSTGLPTPSADEVRAAFQDDSATESPVIRISRALVDLEERIGGRTPESLPERRTNPLHRARMIMEALTGAGALAGLEDGGFGMHLPAGSEELAYDVALAEDAQEAQAQADRICAACEGFGLLVEGGKITLRYAPGQFTPPIAYERVPQAQETPPAVETPEEPASTAHEAVVRLAAVGLEQRLRAVVEDRARCVQMLREVFKSAHVHPDYDGSGRRRVPSVEVVTDSGGHLVYHVNLPATHAKAHADALARILDGVIVEQDRPDLITLRLSWALLDVMGDDPYLESSMMGMSFLLGIEDDSDDDEEDDQ